MHAFFIFLPAPAYHLISEKIIVKGACITNLCKDEMDFLNTVVFSEENMAAEFESWVESFESYLKKRRKGVIDINFSQLISKELLKTILPLYAVEHIPTS